MTKHFKDILRAPHPNTSDQAANIANAVLANPDRLEELYDCYFCRYQDVRQHVSAALLRVQAAQPDLLCPYIERFLNHIAPLNNVSVRRRLPKTFEGLEAAMTASQLSAALDVVKRYLATQSDRIILNNSITSLVRHARSKRVLRDWLTSHLKDLSFDKRKSVSRKSIDALTELKV